MKNKNYIMIAVAAAGLLLTACSQEDDFVAQSNVATEQAGDGAVLFDTYLSNATTRSGYEGVMTTSTLQNTGFGIVAKTHALTAGDATWPFNGYLSTGTPNFMWNQYVGYEASNWVYNPLKYWPNETDNDQQSPAAESAGTADEQEGVSFFSYAPYVEATATAANVNGSSDGVQFKNVATKLAGLNAITNNTATSDPMVKYVVADGQLKGGEGSDKDDPKTGYQPSNSVDLLWGVSSGFSYHPVKSGSAVIEPAGLPVLNMMKPALEEKIKFDFKHALARIGMTVVGAFDQKAAGGTLDENTRVTIEKITVTGADFAIGGVLNLNNDQANRAKWVDGKYTYTASTPSNSSTITINNKGEMNPNLQYMNNVEAGKFPKVFGVKSTTQNVIVGANCWSDPISVTAGSKIYDGETGYYDSSKKPIGLTSLEYNSTGTPVYYEKTGTGYKKIGATKPAVDLNKEYVYLATEPTPLTSAPSETSSTDYWKIDGDVISKVTISNPSSELGSSYTSYASYTEPTAMPATLKEGTYYTVNTTPGYFMVIPTTGNTPADKTVDVEITYYVTTADAKLNGGTSEIKNVIKQTVTLKDFTNGKAYNLKLILGLTSVKVDAEVSNWEVGTVESNLPQNLE